MIKFLQKYCKKCHKIAKKILWNPKGLLQCRREQREKRTMGDEFTISNTKQGNSKIEETLRKSESNVNCEGNISKL